MSVAACGEERDDLEVDWQRAFAVDVQCSKWNFLADPDSPVALTTSIDVTGADY